MASSVGVRCINRQRNKVQTFSKDVAYDPRFRKMTGYEPQPLSADPSQGTINNGAEIIVPIDEKMEAEIQKRVQAEMSKIKVGIVGKPNLHEIGASVEVKPKRKYTKKKA